MVANADNSPSGRQLIKMSHSPSHLHSLPFSRPGGLSWAAEPPAELISVPTSWTSTAFWRPRFRRFRRFRQVIIPHDDTYLSSLAAPGKKPTWEICGSIIRSVAAAQRWERRGGSLPGTEACLDETNKSSWNSSNSSNNANNITTTTSLNSVYEIARRLVSLVCSYILKTPNLVWPGVTAFRPPSAAFRPRPRYLRVCCGGMIPSSCAASRVSAKGKQKRIKEKKKKSTHP